MAIDNVWVKRSLAAVVSVISISACTQESPLTLESKLNQQAESCWQRDTESAFQAEQKNDFKKARSLFRKAFLDAVQLGIDHPFAAVSLSNMANFYYVQGDGQQADQLYRRSLALKQKNLGIEHLELSVDLIGLGSVYFKQGKYAQAEPFFARALKIREKSLGNDDLRLAEASACLARTDFHLSRYAQAAPLYNRTLTILDKQSRPVAPELLEDYATVLRSTNNTAEAEKLEARAKEIRSNKHATGAHHLGFIA